MDTPEKDGGIVDRLHELNSRILADPSNVLKVTQKFYTEKVEAGDREGADMTLLVRSIMMARGPSVPSWFPVAGLISGVTTLIFLMALVLLAVFGHSVPPATKPLVSFVFALGAALATAFLGGEAAASGKIPFFGDHNPLTISATGGIAVLIIMLVVLHYFYVT